MGINGKLASRLIQSLLLWNDANQKGVYTGKVFEYLGVRRPILAIGDAISTAGELIGERNAGLAPHSPIEIKAQLEK